MPAGHDEYTLGGRPAWQLAGYRSQEEWDAADPAEREERWRSAARRLRSRQINNGEDPDTRAYSELYDQLPSADELSVEYEAPEFVGGPGRSELGLASADPLSIEAQRRALARMEQTYMQGGMTAEDRARSELGRQQIGQAMRGVREADLAQLQARGMGGSGAMLASMMGAQQQGANSMSQRDAEMQIAAADRAFRALSSAGGLSSGMRDASFGEDRTRRGAIDDFNEWQTNYARGHATDRANAANRTSESRAGARQQDYDNKVGIAAGRQGDASAAIGQDQYAQDRTDRWVQSAIGAAGGLAGGLSRMGG